LNTYCGKCHGAKAEGDLGYITDTPRLIAEGYLVPGEGARSPIYRRIVDGEMPPKGKPRPTQAELASLKAWIDGMARAPEFRRERDVGQILANAELALPRDARAHARWFTLAHLANAGVPEAQLERYRVALPKLLASLTWSARTPSVVAVDAERTIFRVDLRELGWSSATWDALRASYPYGVARGAAVPDSVRADWFVATASRPPLYHTLLELPATEAELARRLGVDLADDIANSRVVRSGFNKSGISVNNRIIERHSVRYGAYWRSYDFATSVGAENIFTNPLGFTAAGGEIIFNLPNGMQAYMLVDARGNRIDKAPTAIVSDPRRPDRAVENGVSCMGCHAQGIIPKADQLRDAITDGNRERVRELHRPAAILDAWFEQDRTRFATALAQLGAKPTEPADEPIVLLVTRYEAELDLRLAAAELGLRPDELTARLARSSVPLGALKTGGTIKRDTWATAFPSLLGELGAGVAFTPRTTGDPQPQVWLDRDRSTWILAARTVDHAAAVAACSGNLELPRADALAAAVDRGLAAGLATQRPLWSRTVKLDAQNLRYVTVVDPVSGPRRADVVDRHDVVCVQR
jgi:hypothetical protein